MYPFLHESTIKHESTINCRFLMQWFKSENSLVSVDSRIPNLRGVTRIYTYSSILLNINGIDIGFNRHGIDFPLYLLISNQGFPNVRSYTTNHYYSPSNIMAASEHFKLNTHKIWNV